jgi:hypothetical protein
MLDFVSSFITITEETQSNIRVIQGFNSEGKEVERFTTELNKYTQNEQKIKKMVSRSNFNF